MFYNVTVEDRYIQAKRDAHGAIIQAEANFQKTISMSVDRIHPHDIKITDEMAEKKRVKTAQAKLNVAMQARSKARLTLNKIMYQSSVATNSANLHITMCTRARNEATAAQKAHVNAETAYNL